MPRISLSLFGSALCAVGFLIAEPMRGEIVQALPAYDIHGWGGYLFIRMALLASFVVLLFGGLPRTSPAEAVRVPTSNPVGDPLLTLRFYACLLVLLGHGLAITFAPTDMPQRMIDGSTFWLLMASPWAGVWLFFVLSGYLIGKGFYSRRYAMSREGLRTFYWNRYWRIAPVYLVAVLIVGSLLAPTLFSEANWFQIIGQVVFWQQSETPGTVIGALWSVQTEVGFYLLSPLLFMALTAIIGRNVSPFLLLAVVLSAGLYYRWAVLTGAGGAHWIGKVLVPVIGNLDLFVGGMLLNWILPIIIPALRKLPSLAFGFCLMGASYFGYTLLFTHASFGPAQADYWFVAIYLGPTLTAVLTLATIACFEVWNDTKQSAGVISATIIRQTQIAGLMTYSIYVWHEPIFVAQMVNLPDAVSGWDSIVQMLVALILTGAISAGSYYLVERRFERFRLKTKSPELLAPGALG